MPSPTSETAPRSGRTSSERPLAHAPGTAHLAGLAGEVQHAHRGEGEALDRLVLRAENPKESMAEAQVQECRLVLEEYACKAIGDIESRERSRGVANES